MNAETLITEIYNATGPMLQWGRVLMNAETSGRIALVSFQSALQWGRVLMNAETPSCAKTRPF